MEPYIPVTLPLKEIDWTSHITSIGSASRAIARYDGILRGIVNPVVLLSPLGTREAVISSRIEGTRATLQEVLQYEANIREPDKPETELEIREILNYRQAMGYAVNELKSNAITINLIKELHRILLTDVRGQDRNPGKIRDIQNWIAPPNTPIERASFVPPAPRRVLGALSNWEEYLNSVEKDPLVQLAILKAQFELIHPFCDGNGRIGRMLVPLILYKKEILSSPVFYISAYLEQNRPVYFERLLGVSRDNDWDSWISFFLQAIEAQANENSSKAWSILELYKEMKDKVPGIVRSQHATRAIDAIFSKPIFTTTYFVQSIGDNRMTATRILNKLAEQGIIELRREGKGNRPSVYAFSRLLAITEKI